MISRGFTVSEWMKKPVVVLMIAFVVRIIYLLTLKNDPWLFYPVVDEIAYHNSAKAILENGALNVPFFRPPFWPIVLSGVYFITGPHFIVVRILNIIIGSFAVLSCYRLVERLFDKDIAFYSAILLSFTGIFLHINTTGLDTNLHILLILEATLLLFNYLSHGQQKKSLVIAGLLLGIAILLRPQTLIALVFYAAYLVYVGWKKKKFIPALLIIIISFLPTLPFTVANIVNGEKTILSTNGGVNFYLGNNLNANGYSPTHPELGPGWTQKEIESFASIQAGKKLTSSEVSSWYYRRTLDSIINHPFKHSLLFLKKGALTLGAMDISNNGDLSWYRSHRPVFFIFSIFGFYLFIPLSIMGLVLNRSKSINFILPFITILSLLLPPLLFFTTARFRTPLLPFILPFAVLFIRYLFNRSISLRKRLSHLAFSVLFLLAGIFSSMAFGPKPNFAYGEFLQGQLYSKSGDKSKAIESFEKALTLNQNTPLAHYSIGLVYFSSGDYQQASACFREELRLRPRIRTYEFLARSERKAGNHEAAAEVWLDAYNSFSDKVSYLSLAALEFNEAALAETEIDNWGKAVLLFEKAHSIEPDNPNHRFGIACSLWMLGKKQEADIIINKIAVDFPGYDPVVQWETKHWRPE